MDLELPAGFGAIFRSSPFLEAIGPVHSKGAGPDLVVGLRALERHCNARGTVHGGVLATLCDVALGYAMAFATDPPLSLATSSLCLNYFGRAKQGDWIESRVSIDRMGTKLTFASCELIVSGQAIVRATGIYSVTGALGSGRGSARS